MNRATERTLAEQGWRMVPSAGQQCCGALHAHAGDADRARSLARVNIAAFEASRAEVVVVNSAGCGSMCKEYGHLLANDPAWAARAAAFSAKVRDVHELLEPPPAPRDGSRAGSAASPTAVAYDAPCHLHHGQRVVTQPAALLAAIPGLSVVPLADSDQCCGSAGIFSLVRPEVATRVLAPKLERIRESGAAVVATGNPGCLMQIGGGLLHSGSAVVARHPVELLDAHYARESARR